MNTFPLDAKEIEQSLVEAAEKYFAECRERVPSFCKTYFAYPGCWQLNRVAFGFDLLRAPLNLFWAPFYLISRLMLIFCRRINWQRPQKVLRKLPSGFTTRVQRNLSQYIYNDLLQRADKDSRQADRFREIIIDTLECTIEEKTRKAVDHQQFYQHLEPLVIETLEQYNVTRTASADITNVAASTILGAFAFKKFTPGGLGLSFLFACFTVKEAAIDSFIFGETLGRTYYQLFPPAPGFSTLAVSTFISLTLLAFFAAISGLVSDPLQYWTRLHAKRLKKMIDNLEADFLQKTQSRYHPKDQYVARALDIFDALKSHIF